MEILHPANALGMELLIGRIVPASARGYGSAEHRRWGLEP
jgi:hypothetical protein